MIALQEEDMVFGSNEVVFGRCFGEYIWLEMIGAITCTGWLICVLKWRKKKKLWDLEGGSMWDLKGFIIGIIGMVW